MGRWVYTWCVEYYGGDGFLHRKFIEAKNREEALKKLRSMVDRVVEIKCCVRAVTW